jgi:hypothetical protein
MDVNPPYKISAGRQYPYWGVLATFKVKELAVLRGRSLSMMRAWFVDPISPQIPPVIFHTGYETNPLIGGPLMAGRASMRRFCWLGAGAYDTYPPGGQVGSAGRELGGARV